MLVRDSSCSLTLASSIPGLGYSIPSPSPAATLTRALLSDSCFLHPWSGLLNPFPITCRYLDSSPARWLGGRTRKIAPLVEEEEEDEEEARKHPKRRAQFCIFISRFAAKKNVANNSTISSLQRLKNESDSESKVWGDNAKSE
ncbi:hypothetical protein RRG08_052640 [Elysia crispata]|uniref:Uncharacterized protein n=1 Tax=Elysia crispata TaxID=231223 RepID=A0AAE1AFK4_9GAST|nr:hypothetical protein RRG08_052640 [Elysia crispata]